MLKIIARKIKRKKGLQETVRAKTWKNKVCSSPKGKHIQH